MRNMDTCWRKI